MMSKNRAGKRDGCVKRVWPYVGWGLFAVACIAMLWIAAKPENTVDFSGVVRSVSYNEQEHVTVLQASMIHDESSNVIIRVPDTVSVREITGEIMGIKELAAGDFIELDYKGEISGKDSVVTAKWIKVAKGYLSESSKTDTTVANS